MSLCPEHDYRQSLTDGEFWEHVFHGDDGPDDPMDFDPDPIDMNTAYVFTPCGICGAMGPCDYDSDFNPLFHAATDE